MYIQSESTETLIKYVMHLTNVFLFAMSQDEHPFKQNLRFIKTIDF